jgi:hypothetical protein
MARLSRVPGRLGQHLTAERGQRRRDGCRDERGQRGRADDGPVSTEPSQHQRGTVAAHEDTMDRVSAYRKTLNYPDVGGERMP